MLWLATLIGAACGFVGMNLSYHLDVQSGPTIVLVGAALFALVFLLTGPRRLRRRARRRAAAGVGGVASGPWRPDVPSAAAASSSRRSAWAATSSAGAPTRRPRTPCSTPTSRPAATRSTRPTSTRAGCPGNEGGESEAIIGRWLAAPGRPRRHRDRDQGRDGRRVHPKGLAPRPDPAAAPRARLRRLGIPRIDLYYAHEDDPDTPLAETLAAFGELIDAGHGRRDRGLQLPGRAARGGARGQRPRGAAALRGRCSRRYNLMDRDRYEGELEDALPRARASASPPTSRSPSGFLTGKYRPGAPSPRRRPRGRVARDLPQRARLRGARGGRRGRGRPRRDARPRWRWPGSWHGRA